VQARHTSRLLIAIRDSAGGYGISFQGRSNLSVQRERWRAVPKRDLLERGRGVASSSAVAAAVTSESTSRLARRSGATKTRHSCYSPFSVAETKLWVLDEHSRSETRKEK